MVSSVCGLFTSGTLDAAVKTKHEFVALAAL